MKPRVAVLVQARMTSTRLPGKVMAPLAGQPSIARMMERVARVRLAARRIVATSTDPTDDVVAEACAARGVECARGPLADVLGRFVQVAPADCEAVVRLTGDCPLVDPAVVDGHIEAFLDRWPDTEYVSNAVVRTMPAGLDVEVFSREVLLRAAREATEAYDREHVTPWIQRNARVVPVTQEIDLSSLRWVLDTADDLRFLQWVYDELHPATPAFASGDVYRLLSRHPGRIRFHPSAVPDEAERARLRGRIDDYLASIC